MEWGEKEVSGAFNRDSLAEGRKTPTEKPRVGLFRCDEANPLKRVHADRKPLNQAGAIRNLIGELKKYGIMTAAIQEINWRGNDVFDSEDYTVRCSRNSGARNVFCTGFFVHKKLK
jgi:hypothetical protein